jgi:PTS system mannose-specific IIA component
VIGLVLVAHGGLATEYLAAIEHVVGSLSGARAIEISADHDRSAKEAEICTAANDVDTGPLEVIVSQFL